MKVEPSLLVFNYPFGQKAMRRSTVELDRECAWGGDERRCVYYSRMVIAMQTKVVMVADVNFQHYIPQVNTDKVPSFSEGLVFHFKA